MADVAQAHALLHGEEKAVLGDAGYRGIENARRSSSVLSTVRWYVAAKRSKVKAMTEGKLKQMTQALEKAKAQARAYVEHPFHVVKNLFRHRKVRYRGLAKNTAQLHTLFALANLVLAGRSLRNRHSDLNGQGHRNPPKKVALNVRI